MPVNLLSDVDVIAISLVDKAANKKKIYLRKNEQELIDLPAPHRFLKADNDWSVFYAVVAEPGWRENAGAGSPEETFEDEWASEDEIRKAAHRFMTNGALVNKMHETLDPYGSVVENFLAQSDFEVDGEKIKKGSWVVGICPNEDGKRAIDKGELAGISIQGSGIRALDITKSGSGPNEEDATMALESMTESQEQNILQKFAKFLKGEVEAEDTKIEKQEEDVVTDTEKTTPAEERFATAAENLEKSTRAIETLANNLGTIAQKLVDNKSNKDEDEVDEGEDLKKKFDEFEDSLGNLRESVEKLAQGNSTQPERTEKVEKSDKDPLAGLMFD